MLEKFSVTTLVLTFLKPHSLNFAILVFASKQVLLSFSSIVYFEWKKWSEHSKLWYQNTSNDTIIGFLISKLRILWTSKWWSNNKWWSRIFVIVHPTNCLKWQFHSIMKIRCNIYFWILLFYFLHNLLNLGNRFTP